MIILISTICIEYLNSDMILDFIIKHVKQYFATKKFLFHESY